MYVCSYVFYVGIFFKPHNEDKLPLVALINRHVGIFLPFDIPEEMKLRRKDNKSQFLKTSCCPN